MKNNKVLLALLVVTVLLLIGAMVIDSKDVEAPVAIEATDVTATSSAEAGDADGITVTPAGTEAGTTARPAAPSKPAVVAPQSSALVLLETESGSIVTVATARLAKPGYIVIYRTNSQEKTELIGYSKLLDPGYYTSVPIQVSSAVVKRQVVTAVIHEDDGDGTFEFPASDFYLKNGTRLVYDEDVVDVPIVEEAGLINGTVEAHLEDAKNTYTGD